jgi:SAM-dependent methyltransferase
VICEPIETAVRALEGSFDLIVCADVLEHLVDPWSVVHELRRVARADTVLAISMPNIRSLPAILRIAFGRSSPAYFLMATDSWVPQRWGAPRFEKLGLVRRLAQRSTRGRSHEWLAGQLYVIARLGRG